MMLGPSDREKALLSGSPSPSKQQSSIECNIVPDLACCGTNSYASAVAAVGPDTCAPQQEALEPEGNESASWELLAAVMLVCIGPMLFGFAIAFTSPTQITMEGDMEGGIRAPRSFREFTTDTEKWYASLFNIGAMIGAFSGSWMSERFGRKNTVAFTAIPHMIAWGGTAFSSNVAVLIGLRILSGWAVGIGSAVTPCYIGEVATTRLRGALGAANQLSITIGIFMVSVLGNYVFVFEKDGQKFSNWRQLSVFGLALSFFLLFMACMPESPRWLAKTGQVDAVHGHLSRLRSSSVTSEYSAILSESSRSSTPAVGGGAPQGAPIGGPQLTSAALMEAAQRLQQAQDENLLQQQPSIWSTYRKSLIVGIGLCLFQQLTGANAIMMYTTKICKQAQMDNAELAALGAMAAQVIFTACACVLVEKAGRRPLLLFACLSMTLAHGILSYYYVAQEKSLFAPSWMALAALTIFILGFSLGMGPIPWLILAEIFPTEVRGTASSFAIAVNWLASFVVCLCFEPLQDAITPQGTFGLFAGISFACFIFVKAMVPETKGKSVDQVLAEMNRGQPRSVADTPLVDARFG